MGILGLSIAELVAASSIVIAGIWWTFKYFSAKDDFATKKEMGVLDTSTTKLMNAAENEWKAEHQKLVDAVGKVVSRMDQIDAINEVEFKSVKYQVEMINDSVSRLETKAEKLLDLLVNYISEK